MKTISKDQAVELYGKWYEAQERDIIQARGNTRDILDFHDWIDFMGHIVERNPGCGGNHERNVEKLFMVLGNYSA
jgi:hypothetical protein